MYTLLVSYVYLCFIVSANFSSVKLKEEIAGILLNPNCRYEANFVPFFTIAEWNSCHADAEVEEGKWMPQSALSFVKQISGVERWILELPER